MSTLVGFPGDPPLFDLLATWGPGLAIGGFVLWLLARLLLRPGNLASLSPLARVIAISTVALGLTSTLVGWLVVGSRHFGPWEPIKRAIQEESRRIEGQLGGRRQLTPAEFESMKRELARAQQTFELPANDEPIRLALRARTFPYVGLDFGHGQVAHFDPLSMRCVYSD